MKLNQNFKFSYKIMCHHKKWEVDTFRKKIENLVKKLMKFRAIQLHQQHTMQQKQFIKVHQISTFHHLT
jgi:hypothetical protein